jgi:CRISPR-associated endonuclease Cas1
MQKGWFRMRDESTPAPEPRAQTAQPTPGRGRGRPIGSKDKKPRKRRRDLPPAQDPETIVAQEEAREEADWAKRGQFWQGSAADTPNPPRAYVRKTQRKPLVLVGHGVRLRIHQGTLLVHNGFTHYPQKREELRLFPGDRKLPSRIIALDSDGSISLDVIKWLSQQRIPLVLLSWQGEVVSVVGDGAVYDPALREAQLAAQRSVVGLQISTGLVRDKIANSRETLEILPPSPVVGVAADKLQATLEELHDTPPGSMDELRLVEARAAYAYFAAWRMLPLRWKGTGRKPIPPEWHYVVARPSTVGYNNRHATHPVNAMLNYAYAVLESQVRIATVSEGFDPTIGYLHTSRHGRVALVYDLMEPLRPWVDGLLLSFVASRTFSPSDFVLGVNGVCRLHPQLSRQIAGLTVSKATISETLSWLRTKLAPLTTFA